MKATLEFNLPDDNVEFQLATNAARWYNVAWDIDQYLRSQTKYAPDSMSQEVYDALSKTRDQLREIMTDNGVNFDM